MQYNTLEELCRQHKYYQNHISDPNTCRQFPSSRDYTRLNPAHSSHVGSCKQVERSAIRLWSTAVYFTNLFLKVHNSRRGHILQEFTRIIMRPPDPRTQDPHILNVTLNCISINKDRLQLKCDGTLWRTGGEVKGKLANAVGSQYSSHYLGTWCIQHYYCWCAHLGCR